MKAARVDAVEYTDELGEEVLHILFEDGAQQILKKADKAKLFDNEKDSKIPSRLLKDGKPKHEFFGVKLAPRASQDVSEPIEVVGEIKVK